MCSAPLVLTIEKTAPRKLGEEKAKARDEVYLQEEISLISDDPSDHLAEWP